MNVNFELKSTKLTGQVKKVSDSLLAYKARMVELRREPVFRVRKEDWIAMHKLAKANTRETDTVTSITLGGQEVVRYDGE